LLYRLYLQSRNRKLGPIPAAYVHRSTCPTSCRLLGKGCYAEHGPTSLVWKGVETIGVDLTEFCCQIDELIGPRRLWRYGVAGDLPGRGDLIDPRDMDRLIVANRRRPVLAYTHKPVVDSPVAEANRQVITEARRLGFLVNLSADSAAEADRFADLAIAPVVTILPAIYGRRKQKTGGWAETISEYRDRIEPLATLTPKGRRIAVCPAAYSCTTCSECRACSRLREAIIGFPAHGAQAKKAEQAHLVARDVPVGSPWTFSEHRNMAQVLADETAATKAA
jgi:hypothetical protein